MNTKRLAIIVGAIIVLSTIIYVWLGGFKDPQLSLRSDVSYQLSGTLYKGHFNHPRVKALFDVARGRVQSAGNTGAIAIFYPGGEAPEQDTINHFIAFWPGKGPDDAHPDSETRTIAAAQAVVVTLTMHPLVMPDKEQVRSLAEELATQNKLTLGTQSLELYYPDNQMEIIFFPEGTAF